ncbi:MAG: hypothetical protein JW709_02795 [Sedimentisphaerales bacterium]|nr:hypothetical protein [Sedimentisphaerales bacterium]
MKTSVKPSHYRRGGGFTLIEAMYSIMIVGLGVVALMMLMASGTTVNAFGNDLSSAVFLADELRAMTDDVPFNNLLAYNGSTFNGVDANGNTVDGLAGFQQQLAVVKVDPVTLATLVGPTPAQTLRLTATVTNANGTQARFSWLRSQ